MRSEGNPAGKWLIVKVINKGGMPGDDKTDNLYTVKFCITVICDGAEVPVTLAKLLELCCWL
jgi:hypothetical protein